MISNLFFLGDSKDNTTENDKEKLLNTANSPAGDSQPTMFSVEMDKCQVVETEVRYCFILVSITVN